MRYLAVDLGASSGRVVLGTLDGDVIMAERTLKQAYETDVRPLVGEARRRRGGALDPVLAFRASGYRAQKTAERPAAAPGGAPTHL